MDHQESIANPLLEELQWVHGMLRRDLEACRILAAEASAGAPASIVLAGIQELQSRGPLFQLRVNCVRYCHLVHAHHGVEDVGLFPAVRRSAPDLDAAVDRLEADHRAISQLLDDVEVAAHALDDDGPQRRRLVTALGVLAVDLIEHLDFEELTLAPVLRRWQRWPGM